MHSRGAGLSTIRDPRVCSNIGVLKIFKVTPKYQSGRRVYMILRINQEKQLKIGDEVQRKKMFIDYNVFTSVEQG
ncbi:hypothetical protein GIB67_015800, partial [Kingdonia uniflora]